MADIFVGSLDVGFSEGSPPVDFRSAGLLRSVKILMFLHVLILEVEGSGLECPLSAE